MRAVAVTVFWISAILIAFAYAGYPLLIHGLSRIRRRTHARRDVLPRISLVVPAYNEARVIEAKIANCVALDYPRDRLEVLVASDGSTDGTAEHLNRAANAGLIRSFIYAERRGKASVLNDLVGSASGDVIVFSDATSMLAPESLRALASNFADAHVGCVSGVYRVVRARGGRITLEPESAYWRYETFIRQSESDLGTMLGAHGSMYAIRRDLYERLDSRVINDDFVIPLTILLKGFKCIYEPRAIASEEGSEMEGFSRRIRIMTGNVQQLFLLLQRPMWSGRPLLLFQLLSHKALRLLIPFLLVSVYVSNAILLESVGYRVAFAAQTVFLAAALAGVSARMRVIGRAFIAAPYYVCMLNAAALLGLYRTLGQGGTVAWKAE
jgi:cellulose synthase/poly-beta-1,6-N-acetylglucosamine synthase-like glycosyltransferase